MFQKNICDSIKIRKDFINKMSEEQLMTIENMSIIDNGHITMDRNDGCRDYYFASSKAYKEAKRYLSELQAQFRTDAGLPPEQGFLESFYNSILSIFIK